MSNPELWVGAWEVALFLFCIPTLFLFIIVIIFIIVTAENLLPLVVGDSPYQDSEGDPPCHWYSFLFASPFMLCWLLQCIEWVQQMDENRASILWVWAIGVPLVFIAVVVDGSCELISREVLKDHAKELWVKFKYFMEGI